MKKFLLAVTGTMAVLTTACSDTATSPIAPPITLSATRAIAATAIKFGPIYVAGAPDIGRCNNVWAMDTFNKFYTITPLGGTSYGVQVDYKGGSFVTVEGTSPGACNSGTDNGNKVAADITGSMKQQYNGTVISLLGPVAGNKCTADTCYNTSSTLNTIFGGVEGSAWSWVLLPDGGHWKWANVYKTISNGTFTDTNDGTDWVTSGDIN